MEWALAGPEHQPIVQVLTAPEVVASTTTLVVALLGWITWRLKRSQTLTESAVARVGVHAARAAAAAEQAAEQTTNNHDLNFRDDMDEKVMTLLGRINDLSRLMKTEAGARRRDAEEASRRIGRLEVQLDGLRDDVRAVDGRLTRLDERHERLRDDFQKGRNDDSTA